MFAQRIVNAPQSLEQRYVSWAVVGINTRAGVGHWPNIGSKFKAHAHESDDAQHVLVRFITPHVDFRHNIEVTNVFSTTIVVGIETDQGPFLTKGYILDASHAQIVTQGIPWTTPKIFLHFEQLTICTQLDHLLFRHRDLASPFQRPVVEKGYLAQLDVDLGDAALHEAKSFHMEHVLTVVRFAQRRL